MNKLMLLLLLTSINYGSTLTLSLSKISRQYPQRNWCIAQVVDTRPYITTIGVARTGILNHRSDIIIRGGLSTAVKAYLGAFTSVQSDLIPIKMEIKFLELSEELGAFNETSQARLIAAFYYMGPQGDELLYEAEQSVQETSGTDVTFSHTRNLERVFNRTLDGFNEHMIQQTEIQIKGGTIERLSLSTKLDTMKSVHSGKPVHYKSPPPPVHRSIVGFEGLKGIHATGGRVTYYNFGVKQDQLIMPTSFSATVLKIEDHDRGYEGTFTLFGWSISGLFRMDKESDGYLLAEAMIPVGNEVIRDQYGEEDANFFIGLQLSESFAYISPEKEGIMFAVGFFQSIIPNSELYPFDAGFKIQLGVTF